MKGHYDGVRYLPSVGRSEPFQIFGFTEDWQGSVESFLILSMNLEQAKDLLKSLGVMLNNIGEENV